MTETAMTTETAKTVKTATVASLCCILQDKQTEGKVLSRTIKAVKTAKAVMKASPLKLNPPSSVILIQARKSKSKARKDRE